MGDDTFEQELRETIATCTRLAKRNYVWAHATFAVSVIASFAASILVVSGYHNRILVAAVAALPALALMVNNTLRFEERTKWFWRKARMAEKYHRKLRDAHDPTRDALSSGYSGEAEKLESEWPAFGSSPAQPKPGGIAN
ncbi:MAG TPA: hypothetical protein PLI44_06415 [Chiayiivirga sp.]|nr:hypothetical protein [Chiayiivirga sp.]